MQTHGKQAPARRLVTAFGAALAAVLLPIAAAQAAPDPAAPFSIVGGAPPVSYCSSMTGAAGSPEAGPGIDLENVGCVSARGDGYYGNSGGGDTAARVEQSVLQATGEVVQLELYRESGGASSTGGGIQLRVEDGGKTIRWAFEPSLVGLIEADALEIGYLTIKAANSYALYAIPTGTFAGLYSTEGLLTNGGQQPAVSHIRFWRQVDVAAVPEPGTLALLGLGALALGRRRRRTRSAAAD